MAAKNSIKEFTPNTYYHLYNRGVEKRMIFMYSQDYSVALSYLKTYLTPKDEKGLRSLLADPTSTSRQKDQALKMLRLNNFSDTLTLVSYCLMPNHFHILAYQTEEDTIDRFMNSFGTRYSMYFNAKYHRVGPLYQGLYKAVRVDTDEQFLHLTRYIHRNPIALASQGTPLQSYNYSSYPQYLDLSHAAWVHPEVILKYFQKSGRLGYLKFVEGVSEETYAPLLVNASLDNEF